MELFHQFLKIAPPAWQSSPFKDPILKWTFQIEVHSTPALTHHTPGAEAECVCFVLGHLNPPLLIFLSTLRVQSQPQRRPGVGLF